MMIPIIALCACGQREGAVPGIDLADLDVHVQLVFHIGFDIAAGLQRAAPIGKVGNGGTILSHCADGYKGEEAYQR